MERRRHERYFTAAALSFLWKDRAGVPRRVRGVLRDMSVGGVFVLADDVPPVETDVEIEVFLRSVLLHSRLVICGRGQVVRVETGPKSPEGTTKSTGFAAAIEKFTMRNEEGEVLES